MAKNKKKKFDFKKVKINTEELSVTKIGEMNTANQNPIFVFLLFGVMLLFIYFLPTIVDMLKQPNEILNFNLNNNPDSNNEKNPNENENDDTYYLINDTLSISLEKGISASEFLLRDNTIIFKVTNENNIKFSFQNAHYFLELYSEDNTFLERILLENLIVGENSNVEASFKLKTNLEEIKKISFAKKNIEDYPTIVLEKNEDGEEVLVCTNNIEIFTYKFQEEKLYSITDVINYNASQENYSNSLERWKTYSTELNNKEGITSLLVDTGNNFVVNTLIDLKKAKVSDIANPNYYPYETLAKVVKFEMDARGFRCK